jgi:hypothetical protein
VPLFESRGRPSRPRQSAGSGRRDNTRHPEAEIADPEVGSAPVAIRGAEAIWIVDPGTAADHAVRLVIGIITPFPHVAVNLIKAPGVGVEAVDWDCPVTILALFPVSEGPG